MPATPRITAVNDSPEFLELVGDILTGEHYAVTLIDSHKPGTSAAIKASQPDVLILDLRLGSEGLRGRAVLRDVRRDPDLTHLPVLLCSGDLEGLERVESEIGPMTGVETLRKPFTLDELSAAVSNLLGEAERP